MYVLLTTSILSLIGIVLVIGRHEYASKPIEVPVITDFSRRINLEGHARRIAPIVQQHGMGLWIVIKQNLYITLHSLLKVVAPFFVRAEKAVEKRLVLMVNAVKGKGSFNKKGSASIYLRQLSEDRDSKNI